MSRLVDDFFAFLHVERGMSAHTLDAYRRDIGALIAWGGQQVVGDVVVL
ncbi:MAG TPA: site-specific integrase, partial [Xylella fastidiosa subsp. multiplex]